MCRTGRTFSAVAVVLCCVRPFNVDYLGRIYWLAIPLYFCLAKANIFTINFLFLFSIFRPSFSSYFLPAVFYKNFVPFFAVASMRPHHCPELSNKVPL